MRVAAVRVRPYSLPLVRPWMGASATMARRKGALVAVTTDGGVTGWGDCAPLPSSGDAGLSAATAALEEAARGLPGRDFAEASELLARVSCPEARWALETALLDAEARLAKLPLSRHLSPTAADRVSVNAALGPLDAGCLARARHALDQGFAIAKIKVGLAAVAGEIDALRQVVASTGGRLRIRLDANRAWSEGDARELLTAIRDLPIDGVEEPLADPSPQRLASLQERLPFAIAVDESLAALGLDALIAQRSIRRLVLKPARFGGLRKVLDIAAECDNAGIELVLTSVVDTAVGVTAAAHLAAALPRAAVHGLATSGWLAEDVAPPPLIVAGELRLPLGPGLGIEPFGEPAQR